jgi:predicted nucleotidyltransferase
MDILTKAHKTLLSDLIDSGVVFMLIGGYAVNYHGYPRYTADMDIWLKPDNENKLLFISFIKQNGFDQESINHITKLDFSKEQAFHFGQNETRIDFLTKISGVLFDEAYQQSAKLPLGDKVIPVIQYHHLVINKMNSSRMKDKADVDELQKINKYRNKK